MNVIDGGPLIPGGFSIKKVEDVANMIKKLALNDVEIVRIDHDCCEVKINLDDDIIIHATIWTLGEHNKEAKYER